MVVFGTGRGIKHVQGDQENERSLDSSLDAIVLAVLLVLVDLVAAVVALDVGRVGQVFGEIVFSRLFAMISREFGNKISQGANFYSARILFAHIELRDTMRLN